MEKFKMSPDPEGFSGISISLDEISHQFNADGTVEITNAHFAGVAKVGYIIRLSSNVERQNTAFATIERIEGETIKAKLLD